MRDDAAKPRTILIVDDDEEIRDLVRTTLESADLRVLEAADGEKALALVAEECPDLVILDIKMPGMDGLEALSRMRHMATAKAAPVVMLTAVPAQVALACAEELGVRGYLTKPFSPLELLKKIEECIG